MYSIVPGLEDPSRLPALFAELARRGWREPELRQLAYGNFLRLLRAVEENEPG
jgi:membrane dipeptidase